VAPTTTAPPPLTAKERAWLKAIPRVSGKIEKALGASTINVTPATMHAYANTLRSCRRELLGAGPSSDRLQPVYALVKKACAQHDKGARCFDTAATLNADFHAGCSAQPSAVIIRRAAGPSMPRPGTARQAWAVLARGIMVVSSC